MLAAYFNFPDFLFFFAFWFPGGGMKEDLEMSILLLKIAGDCSGAEKSKKMKKKNLNKTWLCKYRESVAAFVVLWKMPREGAYCSTTIGFTSEESKKCFTLVQWMLGEHLLGS